LEGGQLFEIHETKTAKNSQKHSVNTDGRLVYCDETEAVFTPDQAPQCNASQRTVLRAAPDPV